MYLSFYCRLLRLVMIHFSFLKFNIWTWKTSISSGLFSPSLKIAMQRTQYAETASLPDFYARGAPTCSVYHVAFPPFKPLSSESLVQPASIPLSKDQLFLVCEVWGRTVFRARRISPSSSNLNLAAIQAPYDKIRMLAGVHKIIQKQLWVQRNDVFRPIKISCCKSIWNQGKLAR